MRADESCAPREELKTSPGAVGGPDDLRRARNQLLSVADDLAIPRALVDRLPTVELEATAEQLTWCDGYLDGNGDPLARSLVRFYLRVLSDRVGGPGWRGV